MHFDYIPHELRNVDQWIVWRTKSSPTSAITGKRKDWNRSLADFETAKEFCSQKPEYKLGFAFVPESNVFGVDLDACRNPETEEVEDWADEIIERFATYTEVSESGTGLKIIGLGSGSHHVQKFPEAPQWGDHEPHFEFFSDTKYFALTGDVLEGFGKIRCCHDAIVWLTEKCVEEKTEPTGMVFTVPADISELVAQYNRANPIITLLCEHGYQLDGNGQLVRPGKNPSKGHSATIDNSGEFERVTFWSSNCQPFEQSTSGQPATTYDAWAVNVFLNYGGDFSQASKQEFQTEKSTRTSSMPQKSDWKIESDSVLPYRPFPIGSLPDCAKEFVKVVSKMIDCDEASVALPLLSGMAAAIGNVARLQMNFSYVVPSVMWTCIVAKSGSGKTPPWKQVRALFTPYDEQWHHEFKEAKEKFAIDEKTYKKQFAKWKVGDPMPVAPVRPPEKRMLVSDVTIEKLAQLHVDNPKGLLVCVDELAGLLTGFDQYGSGSGEINQWIQLHGGLELVQDRKVAESAYVPKSAISIAGTIQPERLFSTIGADGLSAGLAGRFAMACPPNRIRNFNLEDQQKQSFKIEAIVEEILFKPLQFNDNNVVEPAMVKMSEVGREIYKEFFDEKQELLFEHDGPFTAAIAKLVDMALRFSLTFHLFKNPEGLGEEISLATVIESIEVSEFFIHEAKRLYLSSDTGMSHICQTVLEVLTVRKGQKLSARELTQQRRPLKNAGSDLVGQACNQLVTLGHIQSDVTGTRKPKIVFFVSDTEAFSFRF